MTRSALVYSVVFLAAASLGSLAQAKPPEAFPTGWGTLRIGATPSELRKTGGKVSCSAASAFELTDYAGKAVRTVPAPAGAEVCTIAFDPHAEAVSSASVQMVAGKAVSVELLYKPDVGSVKDLTKRSTETYGKPALTEDIDGRTFVVWERAPTRIVLMTAKDRRGRAIAGGRYENIPALLALLGSSPASQASK